MNTSVVGCKLLQTLRRIFPLMSAGRRLMAGRRGLELLKANLTPDQLNQFLAYRRFDVVGGLTGRTYRIRQIAGPMNVEELDQQGQCTRRLCFVPEGRLVAGDVMLAQKVALETFEAEALAIANKFPAKSLNIC